MAKSREMEVDENMNAPSETKSAHYLDCLEEGQQKWEVRLRVYFYILKVYAYGVSYEAWIWDLNFW